MCLNLSELAAWANKLVRLLGLEDKIGIFHLGWKSLVAVPLPSPGPELTDLLPFPVEQLPLLQVLILPVLLFYDLAG